MVGGILLFDSLVGILEKFEIDSARVGPRRSGCVKLKLVVRHDALDARIAEQASFVGKFAPNFPELDFLSIVP